MRLLNSLKILSIPGLCVLLLNLSPAAYSTTAIANSLSTSVPSTPQADVTMLVEAEEMDVSDERPRSGSLILPAAADDKKREKKCMTICQRWGQECIIDTRRGVRKCRRTCKEFGQECF